MNDRILSIKQPWASLIVESTKRIENRRWRTAWRGRLWIHTGKTLDREALARFPEWPAARLPTGGIIGRAELVDIIDRSDDPWFFGPWGWVLADVRPVVFTPCKGALGLTVPSPELAAALQAAEGALS